MVSLLRVPAFNLTARSLRAVSWLVCVSFLSLGLHAVAQAEPVAGKDFSVLATPQAVETPGKIEVLEFFWYGCPHCHSLEPVLEPWSKKLPSDAQFRRIPAVLSDGWVPHARIYYAFEALGVLERVHKPFFDAIHRDRLNITSEAAMNQWLEKNNIDRKKFDEAVKSFGVQAKVKRAAQLSAAYKLDGVPMLAVNGRYTISAEQGGSQAGMLNVTQSLIDIARKDARK
jgi:thiol:disulfide interchange protein DsbA